MTRGMLVHCWKGFCWISSILPSSRVLLQELLRQIRQANILWQFSRWSQVNILYYLFSAMRNCPLIESECCQSFNLKWQKEIRTDCETEWSVGAVCTFFNVGAPFRVTSRYDHEEERNGFCQLLRLHALIH